MPDQLSFEDIPEDKPAATHTPRVWGKNKYQDLTVPSGELCRVRRAVGPDVLVKLGIMDQLDSLSAIVSTDHVARVQGLPQLTDKQLIEMATNSKAIDKFMGVMDRVVCHIVVEPRLTLPFTTIEGEDKWIPLDDRDPEVLYVDDVDLQDRMFLLNYALSGVKEWESFRKESDETVERLGRLTEIADTTE